MWKVSQVGRRKLKIIENETVNKRKKRKGSRRRKIRKWSAILKALKRMKEIR